jgi:hypothetical protein
MSDGDRARCPYGTFSPAVVGTFCHIVLVDSEFVASLMAPRHRVHERGQLTNNGLPTTESSHAVKNIFGRSFSRMKRPLRRGNEPTRLHGAPAGRSIRWKRTGLMALALAGLFFVAVAEHNSPAISKIIKRKIFAALKDPLNLLAERSPGGRGPRVLLSIKEPHERVLSTVRERQPPLDIPPVVDNRVAATVPEIVASIPMIPPEYDIPPQDQATGPSSFGAPPFLPFFPGTPPNSPGITPGDTPPPNSPSPPTSDIPPNPVTISLPEPATWAMMILGLLAIGVAARRQMRK